MGWVKKIMAVYQPGADFLGGCRGVRTPPEKFENGMRTVGYYYYRLYLKKLIHLAVRVQLTDNFNKCNYCAYILY